MARSKIIVEAGSNHTGDIEIAKKMVKVAAEVGADYIKFQSWQSKNLKPGDQNYDRHKKAELSDDDHHVLIEECKKNGIKFLTTCFDIHRVDFLGSLGLDMIKVPSTECSSHKMIRMLAEKFPYILLSVGAAYPEEIDETVNILGGHKFCLMHCVSVYPAPLEHVNMKRMEYLKKYTPDVGYSDHTMGVDAGKLAIARGAIFIEKHFTIDKNLPGKDQSMSSEPEVIRELVDYAKLIERIDGVELPPLREQELAVREQYIGKWGNNK
jgi:N,N'-diacetyllegionaminate synthase